jgi:hypothetical protein
MEGYDRAVQLSTVLDSQPQDTLRLVFPRFADEELYVYHGKLSVFEALAELKETKGLLWRLALFSFRCTQK